jgi:hypothetical protein
VSGLAVAGLYLAAPGIALSLWLVDLWAKSYDWPKVQVAAKCASAVLCMGGAAAVLLLGSTALGATGGRWCLAASAVVPPLALFVWSVGDVNWRGGYIGALCGAATAAHFGPSAAVPLAVMVAISIATVGLAQEVPPIRFWRYSRTLAESCSCCGDRQRAVHELAGFGERGAAVVEAFLASTAGRYETRVSEEWRTCRRT